MCDSLLFNECEFCQFEFARFAHYNLKICFIVEVRKCNSHLISTRLEKMCIIRFTLKGGWLGSVSFKRVWSDNGDPFDHRWAGCERKCLSRINQSDVRSCAKVRNWILWLQKNCRRWTNLKRPRHVVQRKHHVLPFEPEGLNVLKFDRHKLDFHLEKVRLWKRIQMIFMEDEMNQQPCSYGPMGTYNLWYCEGNANWPMVSTDHRPYVHWPLNSAACKRTVSKFQDTFRKYSNHIWGFLTQVLSRILK